MTGAPVAFIDTETTGLDPRRHEIWEVALITPDGRERVWHLAPEHLEDADPFALKISGFYERFKRNRYWCSDRNAPLDITAAGGFGVRRYNFAAWFGALIRGIQLVGAVPSFDEERLRLLLWSQGFCPGWHYQVIDVEALAAGYLAREEKDDAALAVAVPLWRPPWNSNDLSRGIRVDPDDFERHTALGDARWAKAIYEKVMGP